MSAAMNSQSTWVKETPEEVVAGVANLCGSQNITTDAQWTAFVTAQFNATNAPGLSALTRQLMIAYFSKAYGVGRLP